MQCICFVVIFVGGKVRWTKYSESVNAMESHELENIAKIQLDEILCKTK